MDEPACGLNKYSSTERRYHGIPVAPGIAIAPVYVFARAQARMERQDLEAEVIAQELERFEEALARSERELHKIASVAQEKIGMESAGIFEAQALMLHDPTFIQPVRARIQQDLCNAEYAVQQVMERHITLLDASGNEYLRERANDLVDLQERVLRNLQHKRLISRISDHRIVAAKTLTAADIILFSRRQIKGCIMDYGGATSHSSIMARALGVPAIVSVGWYTEQICNDDEVLILDGFTGLVIAHPTEASLAKYRAKQAQYHALREAQKSLLHLPAETQDGHRVHLRANIELAQELPQLAAYGAEGIGLLRTEMMYLVNEGALSEDEQFAFYKQVIEAALPYLTTFRLIDLGGDKILPMGHHEHNPFLGWRGVRILLDKPDLLKPQLRAMLRASAFGPSRIMIPMITNVTEVRAIKKSIEEAKAELRAEGLAFDERVQIGIMIEVPAAALMADSLAKEVDFFSIGTNDLTQYTLAIDRGNDLVATNYDEMHPAVLELVAQTIQAAKKNGIFVGLCGELAANLLAVPLLLGFGLDAFSASPIFLPDVKRLIRSLSYEECRVLAQNILHHTDGAKIRQLVLEWLTERDLHGLLVLPE